MEFNWIILAIQYIVGYNELLTGLYNYFDKDVCFAFVWTRHDTVLVYCNVSGLKVNTVVAKDDLVLHIHMYYTHMCKVYISSIMSYVNKHKLKYTVGQVDIFSMCNILI